jgi:predicted RNA-binding protein with RPS1 domain
MNHSCIIIDTFWLFLIIIFSIVSGFVLGLQPYGSFINLAIISISIGIVLFSVIKSVEIKDDDIKEIINILKDMKF